MDGMIVKGRDYRFTIELVASDVCVMQALMGLKRLFDFLNDLRLPHEGYFNPLHRSLHVVLQMH